MIKIKRIHDGFSKEDGYRILIERIWPKGVTKQKARIDLWMKEIAPSEELIVFFSRYPEKWENFQKKYQKELEAKEYMIDELRTIEKREKIVTLVYSAKDECRDNAIILREILKKR
jgi:uncharacterized protein YeaO (DUF488 family)